MQTTPYELVGAPARNSHRLALSPHPCKTAPAGAPHFQEMSFGAEPQIPALVVAMTFCPG